MKKPKKKKPEKNPGVEDIEKKLKGLKGLSDINRLIFTEKFGKEKAKEMMDEIKKLEKIHYKPTNELPI